MYDINFQVVIYWRMGGRERFSISVWQHLLFYIITAGTAAVCLLDACWHIITIIEEVLLECRV